MSALLRATDKAIPEQGDSDLSVLSALILAMPPILPLNVLTTSTEPQFSSFITESQIDLGVSAASSQQLCVLGAGLWELSIHWTAVMTAYNDYRTFLITYDYQGYNVRLAQMQILSNQVPQRIAYNNRLLLRDNAALTLRWGAVTGALISQLGIVANRLL